MVPHRATLHSDLALCASRRQPASTYPVTEHTKPGKPLQAVLVPSEQLPEDAVRIRGWDFNQGNTLDALLGSLLQTGLQASALGQAIHEVNRMVGASVAY